MIDGHQEIPMCRIPPLVRPACALALLVLLAGAIGVRPDTARPPDRRQNHQAPEAALIANETVSPDD